MRWQEVNHIFHYYDAVVVFETDQLTIHHLEGVVHCARREGFAYLQTGPDSMSSIPPYAHVIKLERGTAWTLSQETASSRERVVRSTATPQKR